MVDNLTMRTAKGHVYNWWEKSEVIESGSPKNWKMLSPLLTRRTNLKAPKIEPRFHFMVPAGWLHMWMIDHIRVVIWMLAICSAEVPPMHPQVAEETISRRHIWEKRTMLNLISGDPKRTRKQTVHFKIDVGPYEILVSNPSPHGEPVLSISESPGDAQDLRPDDRHHGKNTFEGWMW